LFDNCLFKTFCFFYDYRFVVAIVVPDSTAALRSLRLENDDDNQQSNDNNALDEKLSQTSRDDELLLEYLKKHGQEATDRLQKLLL
jgi:hypothetical protein